MGSEESKQTIAAEGVGVGDGTEGLGKKVGEKVSQLGQYFGTAAGAEVAGGLENVGVTIRRCQAAGIRPAGPALWRGCGPR